MPLVNPLFRFHCLSRHAVPEMCVLWCVYTNPNTLLANLSRFGTGDFFFLNVPFLFVHTFVSQSADVPAMCPAVFGASEHVFGKLHIRARKRAKMPCGKKIQFFKTSNRTVKLGNFFFPWMIQSYY